MESNWLQVPIEEDAPRLNTISECMTLCDIKCDNYTRLVAVDFTLADDCEPLAKLRVFRGTQLSNECELPGLPSAIASFYIDEVAEPKTPILAVAICESILFFRHLKPYFKHTVPELPIEQLERDVWRMLPLVRVEQQAPLVESLLGIDRPLLSRKSQRLLQLPPQERDAFIRQHGEAPLTRYAHVVALCTLPRVSSDERPPSYLVVALENGDIYILEPQSFGVLQRARTSGHDTVPSHLAVHGMYETDYRIVVATRYGGIYLLRKANANANAEGQEVLKMAQPLTGLVLLPVDQTLMASTSDHRLVCYSKKGKQLYCVPLGALPVCLTLVALDYWGLTLVCVALDGGLVQFYMHKQLVDELQMECTVQALAFGGMGLEEAVLTLVTTDGKIYVKILRRLAVFEPGRLRAPHGRQMERAAADAAAILDKPKKSSIFVEQALREKKNAKDTYRSFQTELWRLRHTAARATIDAINSSESTISGDITHAPVKLSAEVCGAGPDFRLYLTVQNLSTYKMASNLTVLLHADRRHYTISKSIANLPSILPNIPLRVDFEVIAVLDAVDKLPPPTLTPHNSYVRVMLLKPQQAKPLVAAVIQMPQSEASV